MVESYRPIEVGDKLMPYQRRSPRIAHPRQPAGNRRQRHYGGGAPEHFRRIQCRLYQPGPNATASNPGRFTASTIRTSTISVRSTSPQTITIPVDYGELLVLHAEDETSTVLITDSKKEFHEGTRVRTPLAMR
ncbi:MAG: hypothetical protein MZV70_62930 [Desulfobacterales bacterium]|nr:hypothetical protein [Desulfobacterales bacterium]